MNYKLFSWKIISNLTRGYLKRVCRKLDKKNEKNEKPYLFQGCQMGAFLIIFYASTFTSKKKKTRMAIMKEKVRMTGP